MLKYSTTAVTWATATKDYYISKGYVFTGYGTELIVNIDDLPPKGYNGVYLICDRCGDEMSWNYSVYLSNMEQYHGTYCRECKKIMRTGYPTINPLYDYIFRRYIKPWHIDSLNASKGLCVISNKPTTIVHHKYSLKRIIFETLQYFEVIDMIKDIDWESEIVKEMAKKCLELHYKHGMGACLTKELHYEYHSIYGNGNCTPEQFEEFRALKIGGSAYANQ
jgi:hypothetical protein